MPCTCKALPALVLGLLAVAQCALAQDCVGSVLSASCSGSAASSPRDATCCEPLKEALDSSDCLDSLKGDPATRASVLDRAVYCGWTYAEQYTISFAFEDSEGSASFEYSANRDGGPSRRRQRRLLQDCKKAATDALAASCSGTSAGPRDPTCCQPLSDAILTSDQCNQDILGDTKLQGQIIQRAKYCGWSYQITGDMSITVPEGDGKPAASYDLKLDDSVQPGGSSGDSSGDSPGSSGGNNNSSDSSGSGGSGSDGNSGGGDGNSGGGDGSSGGGDGSSGGGDGSSGGGDGSSGGSDGSSGGGDGSSGGGDGSSGGGSGSSGGGGSAPGSQCPDGLAVLEAHNKARAARGANALEWDETLAKFAQSYADTCPEDHSPESKAGKYGENMHGRWGTNYTPNCLAAVDEWMAEERLWYKGAGPNGAPGSGHFTQVVWKGTTKVGCGAAVNKCGQSSDSRTKSIFVVCSYSPPGNYYFNDPSGGVDTYDANVQKLE